MRRIYVVGSSGSGKTTIARQLAQALGIHHLELDSLYHQADWTEIPDAEFRMIVAEAVEADGWVIDGNNRSVSDIIWARADTIAWFDLSRAAVMRQLIWRTFRRAATREELWNGNREPWRHLLSLDRRKSPIAWAWRKHAGYRARYTAAAADPANRHIRFIRLSSRADARTLVETAAMTPEHGVSLRYFCYHMR
jgi:adenylate kinase family enzyme